jgi:hypothetical protein
LRSAQAGDVVSRCERRAVALDDDAQVVLERGGAAGDAGWVEVQDPQRAGVSAQRSKLRVRDHDPFFQPLHDHAAELFCRAHRLARAAAVRDRRQGPQLIGFPASVLLRIRFPNGALNPLPCGMSSRYIDGPRRGLRRLQILCNLRCGRSTSRA